MDVINNFVTLARQLVSLKEMAQPQYQSAAKAFYEICQKLLVANENTARWYYKFLYFDFGSRNPESRWSSLIQEYKPWRAGPGFHELKFRCSDIGNIYYVEVESKFGTWLLDRVALGRKLQPVQGAYQTASAAKGIIDRLANVDQDMVSFVTNDIFGRIDDFVDMADAAIARRRLDEAEQLRLVFKTQSKEVTQYLEGAGGALTELVIEFAALAKVPVTLQTT